MFLPCVLRNIKYTNDIANGKIPGQAGKDYPNFSLKQLEKKGFKGIQPAPADKIVANYPKNSGRKSNNNSRKNNGGSNKGRELDGIFRMERLNKLPSLYHHQPYFDRINLDNSLDLFQYHSIMLQVWASGIDIELM